ncbi:MAG: twin-arginine translocation signal domain-containing protein, partial [Thermoleophilaceae bacterium]
MADHLSRRRLLKMAGALGASATASVFRPDLGNGLVELLQATNAPDLHHARILASFPAGSGRRELGLRTATGVSPDGANAIATRRDGSIAVLDTINHRVSIVAGGDVVQVIALPDSVYPLDIIEEAGSLFVLDTAGGSIHAIDGSSARSLPLPVESRRSASRLAPGGQPGSISVVEEEFASYELTQGRAAKAAGVPDTTGGRLRVDLAPGFLTRRGASVLLPTGVRLPIATAGFLASVVPIGRDDRGRLYIEVTELIFGSQITDVDLTLRRFEPDGTPAGLVRVPVRGRRTNPRRAAAFAANGDAFGLYTEATRTLILQLEWQAALSPLVARPSIPNEWRGVAIAANTVPNTRVQCMSIAQSYVDCHWYASSAN